MEDLKELKELTYQQAVDYFNSKPNSIKFWLIVAVIVYIAINVWLTFSELTDIIIISFVIFLIGCLVTLINMILAIITVIKLIFIFNDWLDSL